MDQARARKLSGRVAQIVAEMLERRIKDPRLGFVTITDARMTNDLREATVFYTVYGTPEERAGTAAALASATGVIRAEVGRQTGLRHTPSLDVPAGRAAGQRQEHRGAGGPGQGGGRRGGAGPRGRPAGRRRGPVPGPAERRDDDDEDDEEADGGAAGRPGDLHESPVAGEDRAGYSPS